MPLMPQATTVYVARGCGAPCYHTNPNCGALVRPALWGWVTRATLMDGLVHTHDGQSIKRRPCERCFATRTSPAMALHQKLPPRAT